MGSACTKDEGPTINSVHQESPGRGNLTSNPQRQTASLKAQQAQQTPYHGNDQLSNIQDITTGGRDVNPGTLGQRGVRGKSVLPQHSQTFLV